MFNKLLSNLPFNPSLIDQVSFYSKRLKKESSIRRLGFAFIALTMLLQIFAIVSPTEASTQCSSNDIIRCGFKTQAEAVQKCHENSYGFGAILLYYGKTCEDLAAAQPITINSRDQNNTLYSMGRSPNGSNDEYGVNIPSAGGLYLRHMSSWGNFNSKVLSMKTSDGQPFMVMYDCGNIVIKGHYTPPAHPEPSSSLKLAKVAEPNGPVKPGDYINYTLAYSNTGGTAAFFSVNDQLPDQVDYVSSNQGSWALERNGGKLSWNNAAPPLYAFGNTDSFGTPGFITVRVKVKDNVPSGTSVCNKGWLVDLDTNTKQARTWSETTVCNTVIVDCPDGTIPNGNNCEQIKVPEAVCTYLRVTGQTSRTKASFEARSDIANGAKIASYSYDFGDGTKAQVNKSTSQFDTVTDHDFKKEGTYNVVLTVGTSLGDKTAQTCRVSVTVKPQDKTPTSLLTISKKAKNITQKKDDANGTTANAGDIIEYTLTTENLGEGEEKNYTLRDEKLGDVLEYATLDLKSLGDGVFENETQALGWDKPINIKPGEKVVKSFKITVKNPIPQTLQKTNHEGKPIDGSYDMNMVNTYGNTISIKLPKSVLKTTETATTSLPATGPGESILIGGVMTTVIGYFFARSRLLAKELDLVRNEYATTSGGL